VLIMPAVQDAVKALIYSLHHGAQSGQKGEEDSTHCEAINLPETKEGHKY